MGDNIVFIHDNNYNTYTTRGDKYDKIYNSILGDEYGVLFILPIDSNTFDKNENWNITHKLKLLYNRLDCSLLYHNKITDFKLDLFRDKPFYYIDDKIKDVRYLEFRCEMFTYKSKKVLKMDIINSKNIKKFQPKSTHYMYIKTYTNTDAIMEKYDYEDWCIDIEDISKLEPDNYSFIIRMMNSDPDSHKKNKDFLKWWNYYTHPRTKTDKGYKMHGYCDGIIPYIDNYCLKYEANDTQKGYLKQGTYFPQKILMRDYDECSDKQWSRQIKNKKIFYKSRQNFLCELIEPSGDHGDKSLLTFHPIKSKTGICDSTTSKGYSKTLPYFLLWISHKYLWYTSREVVILTKDEIIEQEKEKTPVCGIFVMRLTEVPFSDTINWILICLQCELQRKDSRNVL